MRKRISLILVLLLGLIMVVTLVACNKHANDQKLPDNITPPSIETDVTAPSLKFSFPVEMSSVFNSIFIDEFDLERYVEYSVVYKDENGGITKEVPYGGVKIGMIREEDKPLLKTVGHHTIHVTAELSETVKVNGTFDLHLKDRSGALSLATLTFNLKDSNNNGTANAYFGTTNSTQSTVTVSVEQGVKFNSWYEFFDTFRMGLSGKALEAVRTTTGVELKATGEGFPFTVEAGMTFNTYWTDNVVKVTYTLNVPEEALLMTGKDDPKELFIGDGKYANVTAIRGVGRVVQPQDSEINVYNGYYFAGWFNKADDKLWRFNSAVGDNDIELYAKWVAADYSFTLYTMGGRFVKNLAPSKHIDEETKVATTITLANAKELGYTVIESTSRFALSTGELNCLTFTGFHYGINYNKYVAEVQVNAAGDKVLLKFSDIYNPNKENPIFVKGDGDYIILDDLYNDYQCTDPLERKDIVDAEQPVTYIKWVFNEPDENLSNYDDLFLERISKLYTELIFRNKGYTVMGNGVRIDKIAEWATNELIVPAELIINGEKYPVIEIGEEAVSNVKALTKVDLSRASNLTTFGARAFALDTYLKEIIMPEHSKITNIGDNAFMGTNFEEKYYENTKGAEFIVINKMIYKYVGPDKAIIDLSLPGSYYTIETAPDMPASARTRYNAELERVETIEDGAFENCKGLERITLPKGIVSIADNAFANLPKFVELNLHRESKLVDIGESAFEGSKILSTNSELYSDTYKAILIGSVYYRFLDTTATAAVIPARNDDFVITHIAPKAFTGCDVLEKVTFEAESQIAAIGSDAFIETKLIMLEPTENPDAYTSFNGILTAFYGPERDTDYLNLVVPSRVSTIATNAFGQYARYFNTVQIDSNVKNIQSYAFSGASQLVSVIFPEVTVVEDGVDLVNAPSIGDNAFSNTKGEVPDRLRLFFSKEVIDLLEKLADDAKLANDANEVTRQWLSLYQLHKSHFIIEDIALVEIDPNEVSKTLLHKTIRDDEDKRTEANAFIDRYGDGDNDIIENALIITSNTGIKRTASLGWKQNNMQFKEVTKDNEYSSLYKEGITQFVVLYTYNGKTTGCPTEANDKHLFVVTVYDAIDGLPAFYSSEVYEHNGQPIIMHGKTEENSKFWLTGLDGQVSGTKTYPTFYTSSNRTEIESGVRLRYKDIHGKYHEIAPTSIIGFNPNAETNEAHATLTFNFYGMGTYVMDYTYAVVRSKIVGLEQTGPIIVPINANATTYFRNYNINLVGQDGKREPRALHTFTITAVGEKMDANGNPVLDGNGNPIMNTDVTVPDTSKLGLRKMTIKFTSPDTLNPNGIELDVCYAVVLEADADLFDYEIIRDPNKTARIIGCHATTAETIVVPSTCVIGGVEYDIVQIGYFQDSPYGVFEGFESLRTVYLPESIQRLGVNTFAGCKRLTNVYTSIQAENATPVVIPTNELIDETDLDGKTVKVNKYFDEKKDENGNVVSYFELDGNMVEWKVIPVELKTLDGLTYGNELVIAGDYIVSESEHIKYRLVSIKHGVKIDKPIALMDIYLPDTMYNKIVIYDSLGNRFNSLHDNVYLYTSGSDFMFKTENHVPKGLTEVKNGAFRGCEQLTFLDFSHATNLNLIGAMAFAESGLTSIDFSNNTKLTEINNQLFQNAPLLKTVKLHSGVRVIADYAFYGCKMLESITGYGENLIRIGASAFSQCGSLAEIQLYKSIKTMEANAFATCGALTVYCNFGESVIKESGYSWNSSWKDLTTPVVWNSDTNDVASDGLIYFVNSDGLRYALNTTTKTATVVGQKLSLSGEIVIPEKVAYKVGGVDVEFTVTAIGERAFYSNNRITSVSVTSEVKSIAAYAFANCTELQFFKFSTKNAEGEDVNGLTTVISTAFQGCDKLVQRPTVNTQATNA